ncbi:MAG: DUF1838 family protein [Gammaproteobacteria bacterium]|nr:DUF1838 family protein [Gammaproteobacteria bacterium]MCY4210430.1 DUF1838 family protein [Gammaproteobacteria bacterium]MCY4281734.1 DUF1838 family protein [Gammaproteobacteria bacterium]MCY4339532.1 DUF1838 family protein [Gammaproteobacteria bacterium]
MKITFTLAWAGAALLAASGAVAQIDFATGTGYIQAQRKIHCSLKDNDPVTYMWQGKGYARVPGERDKLLFRVLGMNVRQCVTANDPEKGEGYRLVSREIMLYLHPQTGEILREWDNPWTGETLEVLHVANDPVNQPPSFSVGRDGKQRRFEPMMIGDTAFLAYEIPLFYTNPLGGDYQAYVGNRYHATEIFDFTADINDIADLSKDTAKVNVAWVRMAPWLPWMKMGSRAGLTYFNAVGAKLNSWDDLPALMKDEIKANYPDYTSPPPGDDARPNETSWTYFKKIKDTAE